MRATHIGGCLVTVLVLVSGCARRAAEPAISTPEPDVEIRPEGVLVRPTGENTDLVSLEASIGAIAKEQDWPPNWRDRLTEFQGRNFVGHWREERAVALTIGSDVFTLIVLGGKGLTLPGEDVQVLGLFDRQGRTRDLLDCRVSNRVTGGGVRFHTVVRPEPEADGTRAVVRIDGVSASGNFEHSIGHGGRVKRYYWGDAHLPAGRPTKWDLGGLCRVAIRADGFRIIFPGDVDPHLR